MKVEYELGKYKFEWDSEKAEKNLKKHKVSFETGVRVFLDDNNIDEFDESIVILKTDIKLSVKLEKFWL